MIEGQAITEGLSTKEDLPIKVLCDVYKSSANSDMYLFVARSDGLSRVPESLLQRFGKPQRALTLMIDPQRQLARADAEAVLDSLQQRGFYLQLPPAAEDYMQAVNRHSHQHSHQHDSKLQGGGQ